MSHEPSYHEALDRFVDGEWARRRFGRKVFRDGKLVRWERFMTPEKQIKALKEAEKK